MRATVSSRPGEAVNIQNSIDLGARLPLAYGDTIPSQSAATARDVWALPLTGADRKPFPVVQTAAEETSGKFAPDGKHVAYVSDETGRDEVFVRPFPGPGPASRVSIGGGEGPFWRRDGKELYYSSGGQLMAVSISESSKGVLNVGLPRSLFKTPGFVAPESDGQRFLFPAPLSDTSTPPITVIMNWADQEKQACGGRCDAKQRPSRQ